MRRPQRGESTSSRPALVLKPASRIYSSAPVDESDGDVDADPAEAVLYLPLGLPLGPSSTDGAGKKAGMEKQMDTTTT